MGSLPHICENGRNRTEPKENWSISYSRPKEEFMICPFCSETIPDGAKFCSQCGKRLIAQEERPRGKEFAFPKSTAVSGRWTAETELGVIEPFTMPIASLIMERIAEGRYQFLILTPPAVIENCRFLQFCSDDHGKLHGEMAMAKGNGEVVLRAADNLGIRDAVLMCEAFMNGTLPRFPGTCKPYTI